MRRFEHHVDEPHHHHPPATVQLVLDPGDEAATAQWVWAQAGPRQLVLEPGPGTRGEPGLYKHLLAALGPGTLRETGEQVPPLGLVLSWAPIRCWRPQLADLAGVLVRGEVSELFALRAGMLPVTAWVALHHLAQHAGLQLSLVVQGRPPTPDQLATLDGSRLRRSAATTLACLDRSCADGRGGPWWGRPCHRAGQAFLATSDGTGWSG
jgi:hypothetical protein